MNIIQQVSIIYGGFCSLEIELVMNLKRPDLREQDDLGKGEK